MTQLTYNPLNLKIGQLIQISNVSEVKYNEHGERLITKTKCKPIIVAIIGSCKLAIGKYRRGTPKYFNGDFEDYEEPSLTVSKYIWLYQTREHFHKKIILISPEDIEAYHYTFSI